MFIFVGIVQSTFPYVCGQDSVRDLISNVVTKTETHVVMFDAAVVMLIVLSIPNPVDMCCIHQRQPLQNACSRAATDDMILFYEEKCTILLAQLNLN